MYNQAQKNDFINSTYDTVRAISYARSLFDLIQPHEEAAGVDVALMSLEDLQNAIDDLDKQETSSSPVSLFAISMILNYVKWLKKFRCPFSDNITRVTSKRIEDMKYFYVDSPEMILETLDDKTFQFQLPVFNCANLTFRGYLWMAFMGVPEEDALNAKIENVNLGEMRMEFGHNHYPIPRIAFFEFYQLCTLKEMIFNWENQPSLRPRFEGDWILRDSRSNGNSANRMRSEVSKRFSVDDTDKRYKVLSFSRLAMSGLFYRTYQKELKGGEPNFLHYFEDSKEFRSNKDKIKRYNKEYKANYDLWKIAFGKTNL